MKGQQPLPGWKTDPLPDSPGVPSPSGVVVASGPAPSGKSPLGKRSVDGKRAPSGLDHVADADFSGADWRGRRVSRTIFENVSFKGADLRGVVFESVIFRRCNFQGACLDGAELRRVSGAYILAEGVSLRQVRGDNTQWIGCFREADFTGSHWSHSNFYSSDLRGAIGIRSLRDGRLRAASIQSPSHVSGRESAVLHESRVGSDTRKLVPEIISPGGGSPSPQADTPPANRSANRWGDGFPPFRETARNR